MRLPSFINRSSRLLEGYRRYHFEIRHLAVLALVLILFQFVVLYLNQSSLRNVFGKSQQWYQQDAAERIANLTSSSVEMLLESRSARKSFSESERRQIIQDFNILFSQQLLDKNVQSVCILIPRGNGVVAIDDGQQLFDFFFGDPDRVRGASDRHREAIALFQTVRDTLKKIEQTTTIMEGEETFHVFIPFVPRGESAGAMYMRSAPNLSFLTDEMAANFGRTALVYSGLIIFGLLAMFVISSRTLNERNEAQQLLFDEQKRRLAEEINHQKEMVFTKRIYHTHHKAEKVSGFIKEDLRNLTPDNIREIKDRISKYASFVARVIYDMKWYDPPIQTIRGPMFRSNVNDVIRFIVEHLFLRVSDGRETVQFDLRLDDAMPAVSINEYSIWEVLEPIVQNSLDHSDVEHKCIMITTEYNGERNRSTIAIADNGRGIRPDLLEANAAGVKNIFMEHVTSGGMTGKEHTGYGCYIAYELATQRFGWTMDAENLPGGGCRFTFIVPHGPGKTDA